LFEQDFFVSLELLCAQTGPPGPPLNMAIVDFCFFVCQWSCWSWIFILWTELFLCLQKNYFLRFVVACFLC